MIHRAIHSNLIAALAATLAILTLPIHSAIAANLNRADITETFNRVSVVDPGGKERAANSPDKVKGDQGVRTGIKSRAELLFEDLTLTRLGSNTFFEFNPGTRELNLKEGTMILQVPKRAGGARIRTAAVTAAITGTTVMIEYSPGEIIPGSNPPKRRKGHIKVIVFEGTLRLFLNNVTGESMLVEAGQMVILSPDALRIPEPVNVDIARLAETSLLANNRFWPDKDAELRMSLIDEEIAVQRKEIKKGYLVETNLFIMGGGTNVVLGTEELFAELDQRYAATDQGSQPGQTSPAGTNSSSSSSNSTGGSGGGGGPGPGPIQNPNPYQIGGNTTITTNPSITTNGITDLGETYLGEAVSGVPPAIALFGSTSSFDEETGFDSNFFGIGGTPSGFPEKGFAVFKFANLNIVGGPIIDTTNGSIDLALISQGNITSGTPGGTFDMSGLRSIFLGTVNGFINLAPELSFSGSEAYLELYARGSNGNISLESAVDLPSGSLFLTAQGDIHLDGDITARTVQIFNANTVSVDGDITTDRFVVRNFDVFAGGTGFIDAETVDIFDLGADELRIDMSLFDSARTTGFFAGANKIVLESNFAPLAPGGIFDFTAGAGGLEGIGYDLKGLTNFSSSGNVFLNDLDAETILISSGTQFGGFVVSGFTIIGQGDLYALEFNMLDSIQAYSLSGQQVIAGADITTHLLNVRNLETPGDLIAGSIGPEILSITESFLHRFIVNSVIAEQGIRFNGTWSDFFAQSHLGASLDIEASFLNFGSNGINGADFSGGDAPVGSGQLGRDAGSFTVVAEGPIIVDAPIVATTGRSDPIDNLAGNGGSISLTSVSDAITVSAPITVSSDRDSGMSGPAGRSNSAAAGSINLQAAASIDISNTGELLALLNSAPATDGKGGMINVKSTNGNLQVNGKVIADKGTIDMQSGGPAGSGMITFDGASLAADVIRVSALGPDGQVIVRAGSSLDANSTLLLYGGTGSNGKVLFTGSGDVNLRGNPILITARTVQIDSPTHVNNSGQTNVTATNHNYGVGAGGGNFSNAVNPTVVP